MKKDLNIKIITCINSWQCRALAFLTIALKHSANEVKSLQDIISALLALIKVMQTLNRIFDPS